MRRLNHPVYRGRTLQVVADAVLCALAFLLAFRLRFLDEANGIPDRYWTLFVQSVAIVAIGKVLVFAAFGLYQKWWRYVGLRDLLGIVRAVAVASLILIVVFTVAKPFEDSLPRSVAVMDFMFTLGLVGGARILVRMVMERPGRGARIARGRDVLVIGAGSGGQMVVRELQLNPDLGSVAIGFVDDDPRKRGMRMLGLKVLGSRW
jgi:FlaA1/EpsC-like NDP-sugar epimerase